MEQYIFTFDILLGRMRLGKEESPFVICRKEDLFSSHEYPVKIDLPCMFLCLSGEMEIEINLTTYRFDNRHMLCFTTPCACRIVKRSPDFKCVGLLLSKPYWRQLLFSEQRLGSIALRDSFMNIKDSESASLEEFHQLLDRCAGRHGESCGADVSYHLIAAMFYQILGIYESNTAVETPLSHAEKLLYEFLDALHANYKEHKEVPFYASRLSLTPRYFTTVIRQVSGRTVSQWIEEHVVLEAQILLRNSTLAVKEIAYELGFGDTSHFSKYFCRVTGMSPMKYRRHALFSRI